MNTPRMTEKELAEHERRVRISRTKTGWKPAAIQTRVRTGGSLETPRSMTRVRAKNIADTGTRSASSFFATAQTFFIPGPLPGAAAMRNRRYRARKRGEGVPLVRPFWTDEECDRVRNAYKENHGETGGWLIALAANLGRHPANVVRKAKTLGCVTNRKRSHDKHHPRPPFTIETCEKMSASAVRRVTMMPSLLKSNHRGKSGYRADLNGQYFRSRWEANYARFLNFMNIEWSYEKKTFWFMNIKRGVRSYTPDFYLPRTDEYHEVKGYMDAKSKTKLKRMKKYYPGVKIIVLDNLWFGAAKKQGWHKIIAGWE